MQKNSETTADDKHEIIKVKDHTRLLNLIKNFQFKQKDSQVIFLKMYDHQIRLRDLVYYDKNSPTKTSIELTIVMKHCVFTNLMILALEKSGIENCQFLKYLSCESLTSLILTDNKITQLKPLNSSNFPNLKSLKLDINPLLQCSLNKVEFSHGFSYLCLETVFQINVKYSVPELSSFVLKMNCPKIKYIEVGNRKKNIVKWKIDRQIKRKFCEFDENGKKVSEVKYC